MKRYYRQCMSAMTHPDYATLVGPFCASRKEGWEKVYILMRLPWALAINAELTMLYWDIGKTINQIQNEQGWGATVTARLANDIKNELPKLKGFSERNLKFMVQFYKEHHSDDVIGKQAVSQLENANQANTEFMKQAVSQIPWGHNILLMQKIKDKQIRFWYVQQTLLNGWSRDVLSLMIKSDLHLRQGEAINNFSKPCPIHNLIW